MRLKQERDFQIFCSRRSDNHTIDLLAGQIRIEGREEVHFVFQNEIYDMEEKDRLKSMKFGSALIGALVATSTTCFTVSPALSSFKRSMSSPPSFISRQSPTSLSSFTSNIFTTEGTCCLPPTNF